MSSLLPVRGLRWPLEMVRCPLDPENPTTSCKSRALNLHVHFKNTCETARPSRACVCEKPPSVRRMSLYRGNVGHSALTRVELVGVPRPKSGAGRRVGGPEIVLNFCCACLTMQRVVLNLRVQMQTRCSLSPSRGTQLLRYSAEVTGLLGGGTHARARGPAPLRRSY